jgi:hypothetical protein
MRGHTARCVAPARKEPDDVKAEFLKIRVTTDRLRRWKEAAAAAKAYEENEDLDFSAWVRRALNRVAELEAASRFGSRSTQRRPR